jgi:hypothetical protein
LTAYNFMEFRMNTEFVAFDQPHHLGEIATHPLARLFARLPLSLLLAYPGRPRRRFAADTRPDAPSGASNRRF